MEKIEEDFISYLEKLNPEDWNILATSRWTVKDVIAHLVGWEREVTRTLEDSFKTKTPAWFMEQESWDDFNQKIVDDYKSYTPKELLKEWQEWQGKLESKIKELGEKEIRQDKDMAYLFDEAGEGHYEHHWKQIRKALDK